MKESFLGDVYGQTRLAWKQFFELDSERQRDRYAVREPAAEEPAAAVSQRLLRARFRHSLRHHPAASSAHPGQEFSAARVGTVSAPGGGCGPADPGGIFARHQHAADGAGGEHSHRRSGEPADGVEVNPRAGSSGTAVSSGAAQRRLRVFVFGRREPAGTASGGAQAGAHAGSLRSTPRWHPPLAGLYAQPGREPVRLGRPAWQICIGAGWKAGSSA